MDRQLRSCVFRVFVAAALIAGSAHAASYEQSLEAGKIARDRVVRSGPSALVSTCGAGTRITPPVTINGTMTTNECIYIGSRDKVYSFNAVAGQTLSVDYRSNAFDVFLIIDSPDVHEYGERQSYLSSGTSRTTASFTIPASGEFTIEAMTLDDYDDTSKPTTGPFTLTVNLSGSNGSGCVADSRTLCLNNNRFALTTDWRTSSGSTGVGTAVPLSGDTGYFWFFSESNVELVVKVLDGRPVNGKFWVFYGALSDVQYTITVRDTEKGTTKTYTNQQGKLASVADTSAFTP